MSRIILVVVGLVCSLLAMPGQATGADRKHRVTLDRPRAVAEGHVLLKGRVSDGRGRVTLQRSADGRWVNLKTLRVRNHAYDVTVAKRPRQQRYRVRAGSTVSQTRVVRPSRPTATQDACGPRPRKSDGSRWSCTFVDDFDATRLNRDRWVPQKLAAGNNTCYRDHPDNIEVARGTLRLTVLKLPRPGPCHGLYAAYAGAQLSTYRLFSQRYGRFEARYMSTATTARGLHEAFWLWPDDRQDIRVPWPAAGEIDIAETYSSRPHLVIPFLHYTWNDNGGPKPGVNTAWDCLAARGEFNTYTLEWSARRIEILVNGDSCLVNTAGDEAFTRRFIMALTQTLGTQTNYHDSRTPLPATMTVDYVRVWR